MPKKKDLSETLQELFANPAANFDKIASHITDEQEKLTTIRDMAQEHIEWLTALWAAMQRIKLQALVDKELKQRDDRPH